MLIVYDRKTEKIVGHCSRVFHDGKWREATMDEILPNEDKTNLASVYFPDDARFIGYGVSSWRLRKDENGLVVGLERLPAIQINCDAKDNDGDDVPDVPADGTSVVRITVTTADSSDTDITFRTTRGALSQRTVHTNKGQGRVDLRAPTETVAVVVTASAEGYRPADLKLEFVPVGK
jgi:hypothetical protein